jgi:hypothetical protein
MDTDSREKASAVCDGHGMHLPTIRELVLLYANSGMRVIDVTSANFAQHQNPASSVADKNSDVKLNDFVTRNEGWAPPSRNAGQVWLWSSSVDSREGLSHEPLIFNAVNGVVNSCCSDVDGSHAAHFGFIRCAAGVTKSPSQLH